MPIVNQSQLESIQNYNFLWDNTKKYFEVENSILNKCPACFELIEQEGNEYCNYCWNQYFKMQPRVGSSLARSSSGGAAKNKEMIS